MAGALRAAGLGTLLLDLLTPEEEAADRLTGHLRFDIGLLARRLQRANPGHPLSVLSPVWGPDAGCPRQGHRAAGGNPRGGGSLTDEDERGGRHCEA